MTVSYRSTTSASGNGTLTPARPAGVQAGDQLWAIHFHYGHLADMTASGWTSQASNDAFTPSTRVWRRTATAAEPSLYSFGQAGDGTVHVIALRDASTTANVATAFSAGTDTVTPAVAPADASAVEIRVAGVYSYPGTVTWTVPSGYQDRGQAQSGNLVGSVAATRQTSSSASSGEKSFTPGPADGRPGVGVTISVGSAVTAPETDPPPPFTPGEGEALYRYEFRRVRDGSYLGDLPLRDVHFDKRLLQPGTFSATIDIPSREVGDLVKQIIPEDETVLDRGPGVISCTILRAGVPWGEYWITGATPSRSGSDTPSIALRGSTLDAYFLQVELQSSLPVYTGFDQIDIARELLGDMQAQPYADLGLILQAGVSGIPRDRTYNADEATYGQRLTELAQVENGFEWTINIIAGTTGFERHWVWGYPTLGISDPPPHLFSDNPYGGEILAWSVEIDALRGGTRWRARGDRVSTDASTSSTPLISAAHEAASHLAAGWLRIDRTVSHSTVTDPATLEEYAAYWAATAPGALRVESVTIALGEQPSFSPNNLGDSVRLYFENEWHTPGWKTRRIIGVAITPTSKNDGKEIAQLILEATEAP